MPRGLGGVRIEDSDPRDYTEVARYRLCRLSKRSRLAKQSPVIDPHQIVRHLIHAQSDA